MGILPVGFRRSRIAVVVTAALLQLASLPFGRSPSGADSRPNILVIVSDDQAMSTFSRTVMPNVFGELVDQGLSFNRAYDVSSLCCPSRAEIFTGLYEHHTGVDENQVGLGRPSIVEAAHEAGYATSLAGKYLNSWPCTPKPEFDQWVCFSGEFNIGTEYKNPTLNINGTLTQVPGYTTDILANYTADFIQATPEDQPFLAFYTPYSPHLPANDPRCAGLVVNPYRPPSFDEDTLTDGKPAYLQRGPLTSTEVTNNDQRFTKMTRASNCLDNSVETVLSSLGSRSQNTVVFYFSDNGYLYGEHRRWEKWDPYEEAHHVPFVVRYPALITTPSSTNALVQNVDLAPTIAEFAGIPWGADGLSLVPLLAGQVSTLRTGALIEKCEGVTYPCAHETRAGNQTAVPPLTGIVTDQYKYVEYWTGEKELYDLQADPYEIDNRAGDPSLEGVQDQLATDLAALRAPPEPDTTIVTGPSGTVGPGTYRFTYFSQSRFSTYQCRLDVNGNPGSWAACPSQSTVIGPLADGSYTFEVQGSDETGASDQSPATRDFDVVSASPAVTIDSAPAIHQKASTVSFQYSSPVVGVTFQCSMEQDEANAVWLPCGSSGVTFGPLDDGAWRFDVRAVDSGSGQVTDPPATWTFVIDNEGPVVRFPSAPIDPTNSTSASFRLLTDETISGPMMCSLDGGAPTDCSAGTYDATGLTPRKHTLIVSATDELGNNSATSFRWTVDLAPPKVQANGFPPKYTSTTDATINLSGNYMFWCSSDGSQFVGCRNQLLLSSLPDGGHTIQVYAVDKAGNASSTLTYAWTVDTIAPTVTITSGPDDPTSLHVAKFTWAADEGQVSFTCSLDGGSGTPCNSGVTFLGVPDGDHTFSVYGTDLANNVGPPATWNWTITG